MKQITLLMMAMLLIAVSIASASTTVRVASFNIANLGDRTEAVRSLFTIVNCIRKTNADIIAIQEVEPNDLGNRQIEELVELLNKAADYYSTSYYQSVIVSPGAGDEDYAFIWRSPAQLADEIFVMPHDEDSDDDGIPTFVRPPVVATFTVGNTDLSIVNCHLYTKTYKKSGDGRGAELTEIADYLVDHASENVIALGDFNRFLNGKGVWKNIATPNHDSHYRFVLLESIPGLDLFKDEAPSDEYSTTTAKKLSVYDQIIISQALFDEFGQTAVFGTNVGLYAFDATPECEWFGNDWYTVQDIISDHRPVWIELTVD